MERRHEVWAALTLAFVAVGCEPIDPDPTGSVGDLGAGRFNYDCVATGDAVCNATAAVDDNETVLALGVAREVPLVVAVGGRFDLSFASSGETAFVEAARQDVVSGQGGFIIAEPGLHAFLARTASGEVADFIHVEARRVAELEVWAEGSVPNSISLAVGERLAVAVLPRDGLGAPLAGGGSYDWSASTFGQVDVEPVDASITSSLRDDEVELVGVVEGTSILTVTRGDVSVQIPVEVTPEVMP